ncbi:FAD-binding domain-containing protein [Mycena pura]|uniref:FAD-binding domain-containing protein n=1 Tax=Mycena pura TaxID=153505 RepID=A0AAD6YMQ4_9AGAR|nr:FAD-binding domain-containing protein [Mycena pura]
MALLISSNPPGEDLAAFNHSLGGRLQHGIPFSRPCFASAAEVLGSQNVDQCTDIIRGYLNNTVRLEAFGSYMNTEWETCQATGDGCLLDVSDTSVVSLPPGACHQGSIPSIYLEIETASDVQKAFNFAKSSRVNIVVKNTGHDYIGRSGGPGTLALWIGFVCDPKANTPQIEYSENFVPNQCHSIPEAAVTFGAGVTHGALYDFANRTNITLPGGGDLTVGAAGGYLQGGGHSAVSNAYGLAVDRVLEFEIVTPDGRHLIANNCQNTDLFFALRGGGGGVFGVVLAVTMKALPQFSMTTAFATFTNVKSSQVIAFMVSNALSYAQQGLLYYWQPGENVILTSPLQSVKEAEESLDSLRQFIVSIGGTFELSSDPSWLSFFNRFLAPTGPNGLQLITSSRLISTSLFSTPDGQGKLATGLNEVLEVNGTLPIIFMVAPHFFKDDGGTSITNAWRTSLWHVRLTLHLLFNFWTKSPPVVATYKKLTQRMDILRSISPDSGAYHNEADVYEPNFEESFWGTNYERLVAIKRKYDPDHLLDCWHCGMVDVHACGARVLTSEYIRSGLERAK